jgi:signal transduction histidine kinase
MIEELTAEILAAEKKVYGKVIRMMAHEVNNTIGPVNSILHSALREEELWENANHEILHSALQVAMERNQNLNVFMRNFADLVKLPEPTKRELNLLKLIHNVGSLMESKAREKEIILLYELPADRYLIKADEQQLEQVLINIVKNAIEAIGETGRIIFTVDPRAGTLSIRDTGPGIPEGYEGQLFSPFFSTKKGGQGIGLTLVREILLNHGFEFSLKTIEPGKTEFLIRF